MQRITITVVLNDDSSVPTNIFAATRHYRNVEEITNQIAGALWRFEGERYRLLAATLDGVSTRVISNVLVEVDSDDTPLDEFYTELDALFAHDEAVRRDEALDTRIEDLLHAYTLDEIAAAVERARR